MSYSTCGAEVRRRLFPSQSLNRGDYMNLRSRIWTATCFVFSMILRLQNGKRMPDKSNAGRLGEDFDDYDCNEGASYIPRSAVSRCIMRPSSTSNSLPVLHVSRMTDKACIHWIILVALAGALAPAAGCRRAPPFSGDWRELRHGERGGTLGLLDRFCHR